MKTCSPIRVRGTEIPAERCGVLVVGSGAAALAAADRLGAFAAATGDRDNIGADTVIATEDVDGGTSYNTGSDKQTYYRLALSGKEGDSAYDMAAALWQGGAMHGDLALAEALGSPEAFYHLTALGVPFPTNELGAYVGYKTDHDPRRRGSSIGPYTSREMVRRLREAVRARGIPILDGLHCVALLEDAGRAVGALFVDKARLSEPNYGLRAICADAVVFGVGGPGGLYASSVYPEVHHGAIGLAVEIGAVCANLTESQFGLASVGFRWNVSGTYQQAIPRYISVGPDGDEEEFLNPYFGGPGERDGAVFLKGYQWPFDPRKTSGGGSSTVDLLVHRERMERGRKVYMDFRRNPSNWDPAALPREAREYLEKSGALEGDDPRRSTPLERLTRMNPQAAEHYRAHGIDLAERPLEVAVCAQHNNGGLAGDAWWESVNVERLFPVGEVNGSHGIYRPGGAALNSGQVGALRAARRIVHGYGKADLTEERWSRAAREGAERILDVLKRALGQAGAEADGTVEDLESYRREFQVRMDRAAGIIRAAASAEAEAAAAAEQVVRFGRLRIASRAAVPDLLRARHLALAQAAYLRAAADYAAAGGGTRGSAVVAGAEGRPLHPVLDPAWRALPEREELRNFVQETWYRRGGFASRFVPRRPIPETDDWFEQVWREFREGTIYRRRTQWS